MYKRQAVQRVHSYGRRSSLRLFCGNKGGGRSVVAFHAGAGKGRKQAEFNRRGKKKDKNKEMCIRDRSIIMQSLYTLYIIGLNLILKQFTEDAVTVLGIYYKLQTFFFIPLLGLQQVILPIISFNFGAKNYRCV